MILIVLIVWLGVVITLTLYEYFSLLSPQIKIEAPRRSIATHNVCRLSTIVEDPEEESTPSYPTFRLTNGGTLQGPISLLGRGSCSEVLKFRLDNCSVAVKIPRNEKNEAWQKFELQVLKKIPSHSNLMSYLKEETIRNRHHLIMELQAGDLFTLLGSQTNLSLITKKSVSIQIAVGLHFLHTCLSTERQEMGFVHQDLKPKNIFVSHLVDTPDIKVKIGDFGLARQYQKEKSFFGHKVKAISPGPLGGTLLYQAPEAVITSKEACCTPKSDVFSYGLILWQIATHTDIEREEEDIIQGKFRQIANDKKDNPTYKTSRFFGPIISQCTHRDKDKRPTALKVEHLLQTIKLDNTVSKR